MDNVYIHYLDMPCKIKGVTLPDENGDFTIIINSLLNDSVQEAALEHEKKHINLNHFYKDEPVAEEEIEAC